MKKRINSIIAIIVLIVAVLLFVITRYITVNYGNFLKELMFYIQTGLEGTGGNTILDGFKQSIIPFTILMLYLIIPILGFPKYNIDFKIKVCKKKINIQFPIKHKIFYSIIVLLLSINNVLITFDVKGYIEDINTESKLYEEYYVDGSKIEYEFPEKKRNLIIIFSESLETTFITKENGGEWKYSVIPELEELALNNINFSHNNNIGGAVCATGTTWTSSGMVAQTAGINMTSFSGQDIRNNYTSDNFLNGAYTLGDILEKNDYNLELLIVSDSEFGGRKQYFTSHGNYKIRDSIYAVENGWIENGIWWGYEDYKMFDFAKKELEDLSKDDKPFNLIMLTADTHFADGCWQCIREENKVTKHNTQYENVYASSSKEITNFIKWLEKQDYYKDTSIVIVGDHLSMQNSFFDEHDVNSENRRVYNAFINSSVQTSFSKNRSFSTLDIYPTILASIGVKIPGDRIGLGTNLFSDKKTLFEELGTERVQKELGQNSSYYNEFILQGDYSIVLQNEKEKRN